MIPLAQTKLHSDTQKGNCFATCIASILELPIEAVPAFEELFETYPTQWFGWCRRYLAGWGIMPVQRDAHLSYDSYYIANGASPRSREGNLILHSVIYLNGKMAHDPHPSGDGILSEDSFIYFLSLNQSPAKANPQISNDKKES